MEPFGEPAGRLAVASITVHYTPNHGSLVNQAEIAIGLFSRQYLGRRRIGDRSSLRIETRAWSLRMNRHGAPIQWNVTRKKARKTFNTESRGRAPRDRGAWPNPAGKVKASVHCENDPGNLQPRYSNGNGSNTSMLPSFPLSWDKFPIGAIPYCPLEIGGCRKRTTT